MSRFDNETRVTPSVLDRLIDEEPRQTQEAAKSRAVSVRELKQSVRRDLEWLLNTRCHTPGPEDGTAEYQRSVACYGLPDFTGVSIKNPNERVRLTKAVETALKFFEPRFINLKVSMEPSAGVDRQLKFKIEASLNIEPAPEPVVFNTVLELGSGDFEVSDTTA